MWGHFAPMFHLVDVFAVMSITLVGGRHVILPTFSAQDVLLAMGEYGNRLPAASSRQPTRARAQMLQCFLPGYCIVAYCTT